MKEKPTVRQGPGRPPVPLKNRRHHQVNVALSESEMNWLRAKADKAKMGLAVLIRSLLADHRMPRT